MNRLAVVAIGLLVVAGCGSNRDELNGPAIAWAEQVCQTVESGGTALSRLPQIDPADPQQAKTSMLAYLGSLSDAIESVASRLERSGPPPVADGQVALDRAKTTLNAARTALGTARGKLQQVPVGDSESFGKAMADVGAELAPLGATASPTKDLRENKELNIAFGHAPACLRLDGR